MFRQCVSGNREREHLGQRARAESPPFHTPPFGQQRPSPPHTTPFTADLILLFWMSWLMRRSEALVRTGATDERNERNLIAWFR